MHHSAAKKRGIAAALVICLVMSLLLCMPVSASGIESYDDLFGYSQMKNDEERQAYVALYEVVKNLQRTAKLPVNNGISQSRIMEIATLIVNDLPQAFYFRGGLEILYSIDGYIESVSPIYNLDDNYIYTDETNPANISGYAEIVSRNAAVEKKIQDIISGMPADADTDAEKTKYIHDYLASNITYKYGTHDQTVYGALILGECVCAGYANAYAALCNAAGIKCWLVYGTATSGQSTDDHAWNVAWIDGNCLYTDVTWDDRDGYGATVYTYYNINGNTMNKDHTLAPEYQKILGSCDHQGTMVTEPAVITLSLSKTELTLNTLGESCNLDATVSSNTTVAKSFQWSTSDSAVATVDTNGIVTAVGDGTAVITVTHTPSGKTAICSVVVKAHMHTMKTVSEVPAACNESGLQAHYQCSGCDGIFLDAEGKTATASDALIIPPKGHIEAEQWFSDDETHWHLCFDCKELLEETKQPHSLEEDACSVCGYTIAHSTEATPSQTQPTESQPTEENKTPTTAVPDGIPPTTAPAVQEKSGLDKPATFVVLCIIVVLLGVSAGAFLLWKQARKKH